MLEEILKLSVTHEDNICQDINESSYIQKNITKTEKYNDLTDLLISCNDPNYVLLPMKERELYLKQRRIEIASEIEEQKEILVTFRFNKYLSLKKIQSGMMKKNCISTLFFLSEYYKKKICLLDPTKNVYYETPRGAEVLHIQRIEGSWSLVGGNTCSLCSLKDIDGLEKDIISFDVYDIQLKTKSSYKLDQLQTMAMENGLDTKDANGKSKIKHVIYEELRTYFLNLI